VHNYRFDPKLLSQRHEVGWLEKIEPYAARILEILGAHEGALIDVGGGRGGLDVCMALISDLDFVCTDLNPAAVEYARESVEECGLATRMKVQVADAHSLPFADSSFEYAMSTQSISGWRNPQQGIEEMYRVVKPGGRIYIRGFGNAYINWWKLMRDTGIRQFSLVEEKDMRYLVIQKGQ
jgi:ubiquinone/menaquinone biosynthesis C-methylase UbiE